MTNKMGVIRFEVVFATTSSTPICRMGGWR
jgi:hypothetical protein